MNFKWSQLSLLAEYLLQHSSEIHCEEVVFRTVINRSYYSALNTAAVHIVETIGDSLPSDHRYHGEVLNYFADNVRIYEILDLLREQRRRADYMLKSGNFNQRAYYSFSVLKEFLSLPQFKHLDDPEN